MSKIANMRRVAEWAAFNGERDTCDAIIASLKRAGHDLETDEDLKARREFLEFRSLISGLAYAPEKYSQFRAVADCLVSLKDKWEEVSGEPATTWLSLHARILTHQVMCLLHSSMRDPIVDGVLAEEVVMKKKFDAEDFVEAIGEIFSDASNQEAYGKRIFDKEKKRFLNLINREEAPKKVGKKRALEAQATIDTDEIAGLFYDFPLSQLMAELQDFLKRIELRILPEPTLDNNSAPPSAARGLASPVPDWSKGRRDSEGPYASSSKNTNPAVQAVSRIAEAASSSSPVPIRAPSTRGAVSKADTGTGTEAAELHKQATEFTEKNNNRDPLKAILNNASPGVDIHDISPIRSSSRCAAQGNKRQQVTAGAVKRLNSPSRKGSRVPFDTQEENYSPEYEPMEHRSSSIVMNQVKESLKNTSASKSALPNTLEPPKQHVQVTAGNRYTTAGAGSEAIAAARGAGKRMRWSVEEEEVFIQAMEKHGREWRVMLGDPDFELVGCLSCKLFSVVATRSHFSVCVLYYDVAEDQWAH
jgi:hypothetical protein